MSSQTADRLCFFSALALGFAASTGYAFGIALSLGMPCACLALSKRAKAFEALVVYFASGLWPMIPGLYHYLGTNWNAGIVVGVWCGCAVLLAVPWAIAWTPKRSSYFWRVPGTLLLTTVPPIGLIGFLSPLASAGLLFPGLGWSGLLLAGTLPGLLLAIPPKRIPALIAILVVLSAASNASSPATHVIAGWQAVNTQLGNVSLPLRDYAAAQTIQERAAQSSARVLVFPEFVIPRWSEATQIFWLRTLTQCRKEGQILAIGAGIPRPYNGDPKLNEDYDFRSTINALKNQKTEHFAVPDERSPSEPFDNVLLILGSETATFYQRIPVPLGMWRPFDPSGVPLRASSSGVISIDHQRAAVLICYEQLIAWPVLASLIERPTVLICISNTFWFTSTTIPRYQQSTMRAWSRLFGLPMLSANNS